MKKVAIITWCNTSTNYGETLQAFALQYVIRSLGYAPYTISFSTVPRKESKKNSEYIQPFVQCYKFNNFIKRYMTQVIQCHTKEEVEKSIIEADILVCGSDQIWNLDDYNIVYGLDIKNKGQIKIAYAPSITIDKINSMAKRKLKLLVNALTSYSAISIREERSKELLNSEGFDNVELVLDPTLLLNSDIWRRIEKKVLVKKKYILCYFLGSPKEYKFMVDKLANKNNIDKIISIDLIKGQVLVGAKSFKYTSIEEFLYLVDNAEIICTDSYHGTLFSINFKKNFYVFRRKSTYYKSGDTRITDILSRLGIENRVINDQLTLDLSDINYSKVDRLLIKERKKSIKYLKNSLSKSK